MHVGHCPERSVALRSAALIQDAIFHIFTEPGLSRVESQSVANKLITISEWQMIDYYEHMPIIYN